MQVFVNLNDNVKIKLTPHGLSILRGAHNELRERVPTLDEFKPPSTDEEGYSKFQLWVLMETFGSHIHIGMNPPFETTILFEGRA